MKARQCCLILVRFVFFRSWKLVAIIMMGIVAAFCLIAIVIGVFWVKRLLRENHGASFNYVKPSEDA